MKLKNLNFIAVLFMFVAVFAAHAQTKRKYTPDAEMLKEMQKTIKVVESNQAWTTMKRQRPVINANKTREVYVVEFSIDDNDENLRDVIAVRDTKADKFYEIQGLDSPRPIENVNWQSNDVIVFDQWMNPTRGGRYAVNLRTKKLVSFGFLE